MSKRMSAVMKWILNFKRPKVFIWQCVNPDFSKPEAVVNMYAFSYGEEIVNLFINNQ